MWGEMWGASYLLLGILRVTSQLQYEKDGEGGIRTHGGVTPTPVFETGLFNRSSTSP